MYAYGSKNRNNMKHNSKAFFKYIRGKEQVRTSVGPLRNSTRRVVSDESEMAGLLVRWQKVRQVFFFIFYTRTVRRIANS